MSNNNVISVPRLLMALTTMATLTFGMFVWDAERALTKLDNLDAATAMQNTTLAVHTDNIERLQRTEEKLAEIITAHESRIATIEARNDAGRH